MESYSELGIIKTKIDPVAMKSYRELRIINK